MKTSTSALILSLILGFNHPVLGQKKYTLLESKDKVSFSYRWKNSIFFKKDSPLMLTLRIQNSNDYPIETGFVVDYYWRAILKASSEEQLFCIQAKKSIRGKVRGLGFDHGTFTNEQIRSEDFIMELNGIKVEKTSECK